VRHPAASAIAKYFDDLEARAGMIGHLRAITDSDGPSFPRRHASAAHPCALRRRGPDLYGEAAAIAGKSERTLRNWCIEHGIGRRSLAARGP
jgi:hypothetical protein